MLLKFIGLLVFRSLNSRTSKGMPNGVAKSNLPSKMCVICDRPFTWRKKWERSWDEVTTCSRSCNSKRKTKINSNSNWSKVKIDDGVGGVGHSSGVFDSEGIPADTIAMMESCDIFNARKSEIATEVGVYLEAHSQIQPASTPILHSTNNDHDLKVARKEAKKKFKAEKRAKREGSAAKGVGQKPCDICSRQVDLLIRCQIDESKSWKMTCGKCWNHVSGGQVDGDEAHPYYRYGGLWKNRINK
jgi:hypothetical protein